MRSRRDRYDKSVRPWGLNHAYRQRLTNISGRTAKGHDVLGSAASWRTFFQSKLVRRATRVVQVVIFFGVLALITKHLADIGWDEIWSALPRTPWFYILIVCAYVTLPVAEVFVYEKIWGIPMWKRLPVLFRKRVLNEGVMGYSGEAYLCLWAHRHTDLPGNKHPFDRKGQQHPLRRGLDLGRADPVLRIHALGQAPRRDRRRPLQQMDACRDVGGERAVDPGGLQVPQAPDRPAPPDGRQGVGHPFPEAAGGGKPAGHVLDGGAAFRAAERMAHLHGGADAAHARAAVAEQGSRCCSASASPWPRS